MGGDPCGRANGFLNRVWFFVLIPEPKTVKNLAAGGSEGPRTHHAQLAVDLLSQLASSSLCGWKP
jgi:hypothetical protein